MGAGNRGGRTFMRPATGARPVYPAGGGADIRVPPGVERRALARRRLFLEHAGTGIHADVDGRRILLSGSRRRRLVARPPAGWLGVVNALITARRRQYSR